MEQNCPAISVIIPVYMVEDYLRECLDSAVNQTLRDIEIICVDDGSPDHSADIAAEYAEKYKNVRLIHKENGGLSSARNAALDIACGRYVYFFDSDDYLDRNALEELYARACADDLDIVFFNAVPFFENKQDKRDNSSYIDFYKRKGDYSGVYTGQALFARMYKNHEFLGSACLQIIRRSLIEENGLRFYNGIIHEDNLFTFQGVMLAQRVGYIDKAYYHRRMHRESIVTTQKSMRNVEGYLISYAEMLAFMHNRPVEEAAFAQISDYLYHSILGNARNIFYSLDIPSDEAVLTHGDFCANFFLDTIKYSGSEQDHEKLILALDELEHSASYRVGRLVTFIPRAIRRVIRSLRESGTKATIRKIGSWMLDHVRAFDERAQKSSVYKKLSALPRKLLRQIRHIRSRGIAYVCRTVALRITTQFHSSTHPLVSIILPVYNVEAYLEQCLDSLLCQTLKQIEIIAVDDGSTDRSLEILNRYAAADSRVHVFTQKNQYAGAARNLGLANAKGEYILFLDSDDFFSRNLANEAYVAGKAADADIILFGAQHYDNVTGQYKEAKWLLNAYLAPKKQPFSYKDCPNELYRITTPAPWTKMFRRQFVQDAGLQFQRIQNANDLYFTYSALAMAERIVTLDKPLVYYRVGLTSNLQTTKGKHPLCFYDAYQAWHDKLAELGVLDELRQSYVNIALAGCLYNLNTQKDPHAKEVVRRKLQYEAFDSLELTGHAESYYFNKDHYKQMAGIFKNNFSYDFWKNLPEEEYEQELKEWFKAKTSEELDLEHPTTYNAKIQWIKLYEKDPRKTRCSDKYEVREYVREKIGEKYLVPLIGVWENVDDIDFDNLPSKFVLKAAHGSGWNIIVKDKASLDVAAVKDKLNFWMKRVLTYCNGLELHYKDIKPKIIAEQYLENNGGDLHDYKVWCFGGKAYFIQFLTGRSTGLSMAYYDLEWNKLPFTSNHKMYEGNVEKPSNLEELIWAAEKLAKPFNHVRVDFYRLDNGELKFGELTFTPSSGRCIWNPPVYNELMGNLFDINYTSN